MWLKSCINPAISSPAKMRDCEEVAFTRAVELTARQLAGSFSQTDYRTGKEQYERESSESAYDNCDRQLREGEAGQVAIPTDFSWDVVAA